MPDPPPQSQPGTADPNDRDRRIGSNKRPLPQILPATSTSTSTSTSTTAGTGTGSSSSRTQLPTSRPPSSSQSHSSSYRPPTFASSSIHNGPYPPARPSQASNAMGSIPSPTGSVTLPPRMQLTRVACEACRRRRTKCTGDRPRCAACIKNRSECIYSSVSSAETNSQALKRRLEQTDDENVVYKQLYESLHTLPEGQAHEIVRRIRMGASIASIVSQIQDGDLLLQVSLVPETRMRYDFPYRASMPTVIQQSDNPYLKSLMHGAIYAEHQLPQDTTDGGEQRQRRQDELQELAKQYPPQYLRPYHAAKMVDSRLGLLNVTRWTNVISNNDLFLDMLTSYFLNEYPGFPVFHKDTFLQALANGDRRYCSPLLVNALMAEACHCHYGIPNRPRYWDPLNLGYRFLAEAKRLWELRTGPYTLVHAQSAMLLNLVYAHNGLDQLGHTYLVETVSMGHELGIFGPEVMVEDPEMSDARLFTAWAIFRWQAVVGFHFKKTSIMKAPPAVPLPTPEERPKLYGDLFLQYPLNEALSHTNFGHLFKAFSDMRMILNEIASVAFTSTGEGSIPMPADKWLAFRGRLEGWFAALPVSLKPKNIVWPAQIAMHMEYYIILATLSRLDMTDEGVEVSTASSASILAKAQEVARETMPFVVIQFETVVRLYYLRHSFEYCDTHLIHFLSTLANIFMEDRLKGDVISLGQDNFEHLRSTLVLCLKGLADQGKHMYVAAVICKLLCDRQMPEDINIIGSYIGMDILEERGQRVYSAYPLEMSTAKDPDASRLENLMGRHNLED